MSNYIVRDVYYLWKWAWTHWPWRVARKNPILVGINQRAYWKNIVEDGWFLGWPLWFGKQRGKG